MNKEFIILSDDSIAVTNELGHINKRTYNDNSKEVLLSENKIEITDNKLQKLNKDFQNQEGVIFLSKKMMITLPILILLISSGMFIYGGLTSQGNFITHALSEGIEGLIYSSLIFGSTTIYFSIIKNIYKKKINKTRSKITIVEKLKEDYQQELSLIKEQQLAKKSPDISLNTPKSLTKETYIIKKEIDKEINKTYTNSLKQHPKKLVLRKSK